MNICIIGGSGFVGTELISLLRAEYSITNIDKQQSKEFDQITTIADVREIGSFKHLLKNQDLVVLLAAEHRDDVTPTSLYYDVNVFGMKNVLEAMDLHSVKSIIFTSTVALYGLNQSLPPSEKTEESPFNDYGRSKLEAESALKKWAQLDASRNALILRPTVIFGKGNRGNVYNLLKQIYSGKFIMIGSGKNKKSMAYVGNIVSFIRHKIQKGVEGVEVFNYVDKPDFSMNELVEEIYDFKGEKAPQIRIPFLLGVLGGYCFDILAIILRKKLPISAIRVRKFCASSEINADKLKESDFVAPFKLKQSVRDTLSEEF